MNELFGVSMTNIAAGCLVVTGAIFLFIAWIAIRNPVMFKTGLRNIPRRPLQTGLIFVGLMLSTLIITAAFGTGDTMTHSVTNEVYTLLGPVDEIVYWDTDKFPAPEDRQTIPIADVDRIIATFKGDPDIKVILPFIDEFMPIQNTRTRLSEPNPRVTAYREAEFLALGGFKDTKGRRVTVGPGEILIGKSLADQIDAVAGDTVRVFYKDQPTQLTVKAIVPDTMLANDPNNRNGAAMDFDSLAKLVGREGVADGFGISNDGTTRGGLHRSLAVKSKVTVALQQLAPSGERTPYKVETIKKDLIHFAELFGNIFTSIFVIFGLFSISAGILLIFLIFVMLAAERKPEMGMARAVGAKRRQIVESFLAEGMGYDMGAATIGLVAGVGVAAFMVWFVEARIPKDLLGLRLAFSVSPRSLIVAFCLGVIVTFIVVFLASWRASRLNIVAAIRDLPESKPHDPEAATAMGYLRGALNGFVAFGVLLVSLIAAWRFSALAPVFLLAALAGIAGPWLSMVRNSNFGASSAQRKIGERLPVWPWVLGLVLAPLAPIIWLGYAIAILVVRLTRERRPRALSPWLVFFGIIVAPLGLVVAALQDRKKPVAWSVGVAAVGAALGALLVQWGLDADRMAWVALGFSFLALALALTLRYFHVHERAVFTITSAVMIVFWHLLPGGRLKFLFGELNADAEMFFISGAVLVTCGTFIVVYNADVILPAIAVLGDRFGRIAPAVKTAVAYPLTSRFRTGLTMAMIGLIVFVLTLQSSLNTNFDKIFTSEDALGGFDVVADFNGNNLSPNFVKTLEGANADPAATRKVNLAAIEAVGEARGAFDTEADIEDPEWVLKDPATRDPEKQFKHFTVLGVDSAFIAAQRIGLLHRSAGYTSDKAIWDALAANPNLAVIPSSLATDGGGFGQDPDRLSLPVRYVEDGFKSFTLNLRNRSTGATTPITVIGQTKDSAGIFWDGIIVQKDVVTRTFPDAKAQQFYIRLTGGTNAKTFAKDVEADLVQVQADSLKKIVADNQAANRTFLQLFQGFLALGLLVGIAALGVISLRAVVERRQQIGMLRAIGYQRSMVQLSFLLESGFIALSGILIGAVLGLTLAAVLFTSGEFGDSTRGLTFLVPWTQIGLMTGFAFVAAMVTTYLPARAASRIAIAEALRYE